MRNKKCNVIITYAKKFRVLEVYIRNRLVDFGYIGVTINR